MESEHPTQIIVRKLRDAIENEDFQNFSRELATVNDYCRRALFLGDREALRNWCPVLSSLLIWFYRDGSAGWPKAERSMGGLELLISLIRNYLDTKTLRGTLEEVQRHEDGPRILAELARGEAGTKSGDLAKKLNKSQNSITNHLPWLEKLGLILRSRIGKNSIIYLTPKGRGIARDLSDKSCGWIVPTSRHYKSARDLLSEAQSAKQEEKGELLDRAKKALEMAEHDEGGLLADDSVKAFITVEWARLEFSKEHYKRAEDLFQDASYFLESANNPEMLAITGPLLVAAIDILRQLSGRVGMKDMSFIPNPQGLQENSFKPGRNVLAFRPGQTSSLEKNISEITATKSNPPSDESSKRPKTPSEKVVQNIASSPYH